MAKEKKEKVVVRKCHHCGKPIAEGTSIYNQPNQEFVLGRTRFCLSN